ncbi:reverse transcriptase domain-containing protein [Bradyrhizobium sp. USDA 3311]
MAEVLSAVYEADFLGFSYGFRPGRNPHMALDALHTAIMSQHVNWVLDADIRSFFDSVDHEWLLRMLAQRIADPRILQLIGLWLRAGVLESGEKRETDRGTPQGAGISPLLADIFLHYILDLWTINGVCRAAIRGSSAHLVQGAGFTNSANKGIRSESQSTSVIRLAPCLPLAGFPRTFDCPDPSPDG